MFYEHNEGCVFYEHDLVVVVFFFPCVYYQNMNHEINYRVCGHKGKGSGMDGCNVCL